MWLNIPDFPGSRRDDGVAVTVGNTGYFGTGFEGGVCSYDFYALDLDKYSWSTIPPLPSSAQRQYACAFPGNNCFYVFGGISNVVLRDLYKFNTVTKSWSVMTSKPGTGLYGSVALCFGSKVYICGGKNPSHTVVSEVWEYDLSTDSWTQRSSMPNGRFRASGAVVNGTGYLVGGEVFYPNLSRDMITYSPSANQWMPHSTMNAPGRYYASLAALGSKLLFSGGIDSLSRMPAETWMIDPVQKSWIQTQAFPGTTRKGSMSCSYNGHLYIAGGIDGLGNRLQDAWTFDTPLSVNEASLSTIRASFTGPSEIMVFNSMPVESCRLIDQLGRLITLEKAGDNTWRTANEPAPGVYSLVITTGSGIYCCRLIRD